MKVRGKEGRKEGEERDGENKGGMEERREGGKGGERKGKEVISHLTGRGRDMYFMPSMLCCRSDVTYCK